MTKRLIQIDDEVREMTEEEEAHFEEVYANALRVGEASNAPVTDSPSDAA